MEQRITDKSNTIRLIRVKEFIKLLAISKSTFHSWISQGRLPRPVKISINCAVFLEHEVNTVLNAIMSGSSIIEMKLLIQQIEAKRKLS